MSENRNEVPSRRRNPRTGNKQLQHRLFQQAEDAVTQAAATSAMVDSGCLWWFTWMQFVTVYFYGLPLFGHLFDSPFSIRYYLPPDGWGCTLPELFLATSIALSVLALARCEMMSRGARGRIRMMLLVLLFSSIAVGFSWSVLSWRNIHLARLEDYQTQMREHPERFAWRWWAPESQREQMEIVEKALIAYHNYWDHPVYFGFRVVRSAFPDE